MRGLQSRAFADLATSAETTVDPTGIEPVSLPCESSVFPLDDEPRRARLRRESNPPEGDRQSPNVTRRTRRHSWSFRGPHGDSNPDLTRCKRGVFPLDDEPIQSLAGEDGFEPTTSTVQSGVFYQLNYSPMERADRGNRTPVRWFGRPESETIGRRPAKERERGTGARDRTWTVGVKARRPAIRRTPAREER